MIELKQLKNKYPEFEPNPIYSDVRNRFENMVAHHPIALDLKVNWDGSVGYLKVDSSVVKIVLNNGKLKVAYYQEDGQIVSVTEDLEGAVNPALELVRFLSSAREAEEKRLIDEHNLKIQLEFSRQRSQIESEAKEQGVKYNQLIEVESHQIEDLYKSQLAARANNQLVGGKTFKLYQWSWYEGSTYHTEYSLQANCDPDGWIDMLADNGKVRAIRLANISTKTIVLEIAHPEDLPNHDSLLCQLKTNCKGFVRNPILRIEMERSAIDRSTVIEDETFELPTYEPRAIIDESATEFLFDLELFTPQLELESNAWRECEREIVLPVSLHPAILNRVINER